MRNKMYPYFLFFVILSLSVLILSKFSGLEFITGIIDKVILPIQSVVFSASNFVTSQEPAQIKSLKAENVKLMKQFSDLENIKKENEALHDQFAVSTIPHKKLLPAKIIGIQQLGFDQPATTIILDKGKEQGIREGLSVIYENNLVGKVTKSTPTRSLVELIGHKNTSTPGKTQSTGALGVIKGHGDRISFENVVLSEKLEVGDVIVTKGDIDLEGEGHYPDLVIGKIKAVHKKTSNLFQSTDIVPIIDVKKLTTVFIILD